MTLDDLLAALARATGPDRALDAEIARVVHHDYGPVAYTRGYHPMGEKAACYTASIDAAVSLVDEPRKVIDVMRAAIACVSARFDLHIRYWPKDQNVVHRLALALCIAALRARRAGG